MSPRLWSVFSKPVDSASVVAHRFFLGAILCVSSVRFLASGWVERCYETPTFFFHYYGFEWVRVLPAPWMHVAYGVLAVLAALFALGVVPRLAAALFFALFTYVELIDVTNYLNHYYLVSILMLLYACFPVRRGATIPAWVLYLLRAQVAIVYFYAAVAKMGPDWLVHGQPLGIWLASRGETPLIGPLLVLPYVPLLASWAGFLNDLLAPLLLSNRKTRPFGFAMVVVFHTITHLLFDIGIFPFLMIANATLFFDPAWPRRLPLVRRAFGEGPSVGTWGRTWRAWAAVLVATHLAFQVLFPLRTFAYGGDVLWHEQGMRWSWRVMLRKKTGDVSFRVRTREFDREKVVPSTRYLTMLQHMEMVGQPDLILQLAHHVAGDLARRGHHDVEVRVDAFVSVNGRPAARLIDPAVDLARVGDSMREARYILPPPEGPPLTSPGGPLALFRP
jgi:vitamin K-dependent gamma-carboxylase